MKTTKHFVSITALVMMLCMVCTMFASCFLFGGSSISLDKTEANMFVGDSIKLVATTSDKDAEVEWSTSNENVATVRRGTVSAVGVGTAVITASLEDGTSATCNITVSERTVSISASSATINLDESNTITLTASSSDGGEITWSSSDPAIATVVGGVVTAYDIGKVTITAQRGAALATCEIEVIEPSRPEDYYHITKLTNAEVVADPGVWHYHADGSLGNDYNFSATPLHKNSTASATLSVIPKVANSQYFYFRYQPNQVELNSYYTMTVVITVSEDATLRIGSRRVDGSTFAPLQIEVKAGEAKTVEYIGYLNEYEPFSIRINSELEAESVSISAQLVSVVAHNGENLPEYHTKVEEKPQINYEELPKDESAYDLELKTNSETMSYPDKWHFNQGESSIVSSAKYNNGTITFDFETLQTTGNSQLRFRPTLDPNTKIKVSFTVTSNVAAKVVLALGDSVTFASTDWNEKRLDGTNSQTFEAEMTLKETQLIFIQVQALGETASNASFTFSDIKIYKAVEGQTPDTPVDPDPKPELPTIENGYYLTHSNNAGVVAEPGKWFYFGDGAEGTDFVLASTPKIDNGVITYAFTAMTAGANYQLRYQPELAVGTKYTVSFTITVDGACKILYSNDYKVHLFESAGSQTITYTDTVDASAPFMIQIKECTAPITITLSDISFVEYVEPEVPAHKCESVCADCGKCTDGECTESACESKCEGHQTEEPETPENPELTASGEYVKFDGNEEYTITAGAEYSNIINVTYSEISTNTYKNINTWIADKSAGKNTVSLIVKNNGTETVYITVKLQTDGTGVHEGKLEVAPGKIATYTGNFSGVANQLYLFVDSGWSLENTTRSGDISITGIQFTGEASAEPEEPEIPAEGIELSYSGNECYNFSPKETPTQGINVSFSSVTTNTYQNVFALVSEASAGKTNLTLKIRNNGTETVYITVKLQTIDKVALIEQKVYVAAGETATITGDFSGSADSLYFFIGSGWSNDTVTSSGSITIYGVEFSGEVQPEPTPDPEQPEQPEQPKVSYELTSSNNSGVVANPGKWFYSFDGADGNEYDIVAAPKYEDGTIVVEFLRQAEGTPTYQLRYQPELEVGASYSITFTVELSAAGKVVYGNDYKAYEFAEAGTQTLTWTGAVGTSPFMIQVRSTDRSAPITITVSNITITAN
ncbi:MAG: Ig-like domain-containing protein [Clostridia bacterium]|nr:Ig-like domain-containing protein [Clostridia bacterium]